MEVWGGNTACDNGVIMPGLDAWVYSRPFEDDDAGGDIHYVSSCATGRITRILLADVSGHGQQVAKVAVSLRGLMRRYVNYIDQVRVVEGLNVEFSSLSESGAFATAVVVSYFAPTDQVVISNAGHPRPFRYDARRRAWESLKHDKRPSEGLANIPLGIAEPTRYDEMAIRLGRGDLLLLYTDSLLEARNAQGRQLNEAGLLELVRAIDPGAPERLISALLTAVEDFAGASPGDDVTVLLLRPNALKPRISIAGGIKSGLTVARGCLAALRPGGPPFPWPQLSKDNVLGAFFRWANRARAEKTPTE
jgi:serine phosphatase RsbU (regulator of sigma subunit)